MQQLGRGSGAGDGTPTQEESGGVAPKLSMLAVLSPVSSPHLRGILFCYTSTLSGLEANCNARRSPLGEVVVVLLAACHTVPIPIS